MTHHMEEEGNKTEERTEKGDENVVEEEEEELDEEAKEAKEEATGSTETSARDAVAGVSASRRTPEEEEGSPVTKKASIDATSSPSPAPAK